MLGSEIRSSVGELRVSSCSICLLFSLLLITVRSEKQSLKCKNATENVVFLDLFPCSLNGTSISATLATREILERCDLLAKAALELAVERINRNSDILADTTVHVHDVPVQLPHFSEDKALLPVTDALRSRHVEYYGVVGPSLLSMAEFWTPIFDNLNLLTVSYTVTSTVPDETSSFYRTLPSSRSANVGRLLLIARNRWFRIASISSKEAFYAKEAEEFVQYCQEPLCGQKVELALPSTFSDSPLTALSSIRSKDINIIMGFFGPENARKVLCMAYSMDLVSDDHAWVLPSYYNPNWWKQSQSANGEEAGDCSDNQMREILETVIFIDTVKFPSMDESMTSFHNQLLSKTLDLFPFLTEEDLKPYLLHSRATNAYDAVTLLARSVGVAFDQARGEDRTDTSQIQLALEKAFMCEYCRLHSGCSHNGENKIMSQCMDVCNPGFTTPKRFTNMSTSNIDFTELRTKYLLHSFGQIFYSQFTGGIECPVGLLWTSDNTNLSLVCNERIYTLDELDESQCAVGLNFSKELFVREGCPLTFQWRDSLMAPSSHYEITLYLSRAEIVFIGMATALGLMMAVALIVFNIVWRSHKVVKASSPWLNVILLLGIIIWLPAALLNSLAVSSIEYGIAKEHSDALCRSEVWFYYLGEAIFLAITIAKNWRIYRIFNNKSLKMIGDELSDHHLMVFILLLLLPVLIILIVWFFFPLHLKKTSMLNKNLQLTKIAFCTSEYLMKFRITMRSYLAILFLILFVLTFLALRTTMSVFHREGTLLYIVMSIVLLPLPIIDIIHTLASTGDVFVKTTVHLIFVWIEFTQGVLFPLLTMSVLFLPNVYLVLLKERLETKLCITRKEVELLASQKLSSRYHSLRLQSASLRRQLSKTNQLIAKLLEEKQIEQALKHSQIKQHTCTFNKQDSSNIMLKTKDELASLGNTETTAKDYTVSTNEAVPSLKHQLSAEFEDFLLSNDQSPSYLRTNLIDLSEEVKLVSSTK